MVTHLHCKRQAIRILPSARVEASTRAERAQGIQPALALGFCEAVGRPQRDALFNGSAWRFLFRQPAGHTFHSLSQRPRPASQLPVEPIDSEGWDTDPGRPLGLRLLALLGALSFLALGISSLLSILQRHGPIPEGNGTKT